MTEMQPIRAPASITNYADDEILFHKGEEARDIFIIEEGQVDIFDPATGRIMSSLGRGHLIGEQALFQIGVRVASARAKGNLRCQQLPLGIVRKIISSEPDLIQTGIEGLCLQLATLNHFGATLQAEESKAMVRPGLGSLSSQQAQALLKVLVKQAEPVDSCPPEELLYIKVLASPILRTMFFSEVDWNSSKSPEQPFMILDGELGATWGSRSIRVARGAVFGLAESILGRPQFMTGRALSAFSARVFPATQMVTYLSKSNVGVAGICRGLALKIVDAYADQQEVLVNGN